MSGIVAGQDFDTTLTGDASLRSRPMKRVIEPLARMGAAADSAGGCAPLTIHGQGARLRPIDYELPVASAQIKSCVLLAGLYADGRTSVVEPTPTRDHTERMLRWFGVEVDEEPAGRGKRISVTGDSVLKGGRLTVPSDVSAATFFAVAAACLPGSEVKLRNVGLNPTRVGAIATIRRFGGQVSILNQSEDYGEPVGDLKLKGGIEKIDQGIPNFVGGDLIANLIDEIPILAVLGTQLEGGIEIREAAELRVKESDRINAVVDNLGRMGADVEEFDDGLRIRRSRLRGAVVDSFGDHRIAMSFAIAGLIADGETEIVGAECVDVSFPGFFDELERVAEY
jgi:3-phosphoshikimate 1-carboxyvinyltransferase